MARVAVGDVTLAYEEHGAGEPLLLICGLGYARWMWRRQIPFLSRLFRVIAFDNRGTGESDAPPGPYAIPQMAGDAAGLLDALGADGPAHVLGHSMGSFIAQELALTWPERVSRLILGGSSLGGAAHVPPRPEVAAMLAQDPQLDAEANIRRAMPSAVAPGYFADRPDELEEWVRARLAHPTPPAAQLAQLQAAMAWPGTADRAAQLKMPALVLHGELDQVVPTENGRRLAAAIPGAQLVIIPGTAHLPMIEAAPMCNRVVAEFLQAG